MSIDPRFERALDTIEPGRRDALRKVLVGTAIYTAPVVASFSMESLGGVAHAQASNQLTAAAIPSTSGWNLAVLAGLVSAAGAFLLRRRRDPPTGG